MTEQTANRIADALEAIAGRLSFMLAILMVVAGAAITACKL